jgi:uncharacterized membrane protein (DUF485 family)
MDPQVTPHVANAAQSHNARLGIQLFFVYLVLYVAFVLINAFVPDWMQWRPFGGINLALIYGFGLILAALALAFLYGFLAKVAPADSKEVTP